MTKLNATQNKLHGFEGVIFLLISPQFPSANNQQRNAMNKENHPPPPNENGAQRELEPHVARYTSTSATTTMVAMRVGDVNGNTLYVAPMLRLRPKLLNMEQLRCYKSPGTSSVAPPDETPEDRLRFIQQCRRNEVMRHDGWVRLR